MATAWAAVAATLLVVAGWPTRPAGAAVARVETAAAGVVVRRAGAEFPAAPGMDLHAQDTLAVPAGGAAVLAVAGHIRADIGPETDLAFAAAGDPAESSGPEVVLGRGSVAVDATASDGPLHVRTPEADAAVGQSRCVVGAGRGRTRVRVAVGTVTARRLRDGAAARVPAGRCSTFAADPDPVRTTPSRPGSVLFLIDPAPDRPDWGHFNHKLADHLLPERLGRLGFTVTMKSYADATPADLAGAALVVASVFDYGVGEPALARCRLATAAVPVVCLEPAGYATLGMTATEAAGGCGFDSGPTAATFPHPADPLSGGLTGDRVHFYPTCVGWGRPGPAAAVAAHVAGRPDWVTAFGYDAGQVLASGVAPARRVGLFLDPATAATDDGAAWALFEAAVEWCAADAVQ